MSIDRITIDDGAERIAIEQRDADPVVVELLDTTIAIELEAIGYVGPTGADGTIPSYLHTQASAATVWTIAHNLGVRPTVTVLSVGGLLMLGDVLHLDANTLTITFAVAVAGTARCL